MNLRSMLLLAVLALGCSKKSDDAPAAKPTESPEPAKPEPAKPGPAPAKPEPAKPEPSKASLITGSEEDIKQAAVTIASDKKQELAYTSPSGDKVALKVKQSLRNNKIVVELVATDGGKTTSLLTIETGVEKGDMHEAPVGSIGQAKDGTIVFVGGSEKVTGKMASDYEAHLYTWDAATKRLTDARKLKWNEDASMETDPE